MFTDTGARYLDMRNNVHHGKRREGDVMATSLSLFFSLF